MEALYIIMKATFNIANCDIDLSQWKFMYSTDGLQQPNTHDCGLFVLCHFYAIARRCRYELLPSSEGRKWCYYLTKHLPEGYWQSKTGKRKLKHERINYDKQIIKWEKHNTAEICQNLLRGSNARWLTCKAGTACKKPKVTA